MSFLRYLPLVAAVSLGLALLAGAVRPSPTPDAESLPFSLPPAAIPHDAAADTLDAAIDTLGPDRVAWLSTTVKQRVQLPDVAFSAEGRFQSAPGNRFRLELRTILGDRTTTLLTVSDGDVLWRANRVGAGNWTAVRRREIVDDDNENVAPVRQETFSTATFSGPGSLLKNLRRRLVWTNRVEVQIDGRPAVELTGVWPGKSPIGDRAGPASQPDRCRLLLDADTLWPRRVEWWGPGTSGKRLVCLMSLELADPEINRPLSAEQFARTFTFDPGRAPVVEETVADAAPRKGPK
jgi:hypothetical protein